MSLDVYIEANDGGELYSANITHNLNKMAAAAGIYDCLWRAPENGFVKAGQLIDPLRKGILFLSENPDKCRDLEPDNRWGTWENFLPWCANLLSACKEFSDANIRTSR